MLGDSEGLNLLNYYFHDFTSTGMPRGSLLSSFISEKNVQKYNSKRYHFYGQLLQSLTNPNTSEVVDAILRIYGSTKNRREEIEERSRELASALNYLLSTPEKTASSSSAQQPDILPKTAELLNSITISNTEKTDLGELIEFIDKVQKVVSSQNNNTEQSELENNSLVKLLMNDFTKLKTYIQDDTNNTNYKNISDDNITDFDNLIKNNNIQKILDNIVLKAAAPQQSVSPTSSLFSMYKDIINSQKTDTVKRDEIQQLIQNNLAHLKTLLITIPDEINDLKNIVILPAAKISSFDKFPFLKKLTTQLAKNPLTSKEIELVKTVQKGGTPTPQELFNTSMDTLQTVMKNVKNLKKSANIDEAAKERQKEALGNKMLFGLFNKPQTDVIQQFNDDNKTSKFTEYIEELENAKTNAEKENVIIKYKNNPLTSPDNDAITSTDRIIFIAGTFILRAISIFVMQWGVNTSFVRSFKDAYLLYLGAYIGLFLMWFFLTNSSKDIIVFRLIFWYLSWNPHGIGRCFVHILLNLIVLPVPFIIKSEDSATESILSFEEKRKIIYNVSTFTFITWVLTSAVATQY